MEEGNDTTTSRAAAAADGASTVSTTKAVVHSMPTASSTSVRLVIRASNQQHDDLTIESDLLWSVKRLKMHLASVHPSKPSINEQKLIYSGQLLNDKLLLKDVIRRYKDVYTQNHIIHLVCSNKNTQPLPSSTRTKAKLNVNAGGTATATAATTSNDTSVRQRYTAASTAQLRQTSQESERSQQQPELPNISQHRHQHRHHQQQQQHPQAPCPPVSFNANNWESLANQQVAMYYWLQQVYAQYMEHCLRLANLSTNINSESVNVGNASSTVPPNSMFLMHPFFMPHLYGNNTPVIRPSYPAGTPVTDTDTPINEQTPTTSASLQDEPQQPVVEAAADAAQFPNIAQEEADNQDWLDGLFTFIRLMLFLTLLYINSSTQRCLLVFIIAAVMYCYHIGAFRRRHERNNNNLNRNNNADRLAAPAVVDQIRQDGEQPGNPEIAAQPDIQGNHEENAATDTELIPNDTINNSSMASAVAFVRTFIVTFFTSLFPETPTL